MRCYDCATESGISTEAHATCAACGAGICLTHTVEGYAQEPVKATLGNPSARRGHGRRMFCSKCAPDYLAQAGLVAGGMLRAG
jgi:hypothetical protein